MRRRANTVVNDHVRLQLAHPLIQGYLRRFGYSTAYTAPGHDHLMADAWSGNLQSLAALHDIAKPRDNPRMWDSWAPDEEKAQLRAEHQKAMGEFEDKIREHAPDLADAGKYELEQRWQHGMRRALTMGHLDIDEAEQRGYRSDAREHGDVTHGRYDPDTGDWDNRTFRHGGWQHLPDKVFHVSTDADAVQREGLKTPEELNRASERSVGLGGPSGNSDSISVTDDSKLPHDIYHALHERHAVITGKITPHQMEAYAAHPPVGKPFLDEWRSQHRPEAFDEVKEKLKIHEGMEAPDDHPDWKIRDYHAPGTSGLFDIVHHWQRPATDDEHRENLAYLHSTFSRSRHWSGKGHRDPLFVSSDPHAFAAIDPNRFGILHLRPHPGAQGYPLQASRTHHENADSGEWRMGGGSPFDVERVEKPTPRHVEEFGIPSREAALNEPGSVEELIRHHEGTQELFAPADGSGAPLCGTHALADNGWKQRQHEFAQQVGLGGERPDPPSMRLVGRGSCPACAQQQHVRAQEHWNPQVGPPLSRHTERAPDWQSPYARTPDKFPRKVGPFQPLPPSLSALEEDDDSYRMQSGAPGPEDAPLHDLRDAFGHDFYERPGHEYVPHEMPGGWDSLSVARRVKDRPDAKVRIYRAMPAEHVHRGIRPGDWVSTSKEYARQHARMNEESGADDWPVISVTTQAKHVTNHGDITEYGYNGPKIEPAAHRVSFAGGKNQRVHQHADGVIRKVTPRARGPLSGYTFHHYDGRDFMEQYGPNPAAPRGRVDAYGPDDSYAGHLKYRDGEVEEVGIENEHQHVADELERRMRLKIPRSAKLATVENGNWILFHGTSRENAQKISEQGFKHGTEQSHGHTSGKGFYFHEHPHQAAQYGDHVVVVQADVPDFSIHHNPWADPDVDHDRVSESLQEQGFHGHSDPDDKAVVLYHPHEIHYLTHGPLHHFTTFGSRKQAAKSLEELARDGYCTDEFDRWQGGGCGTYATALIHAHPHLQLGVAGHTFKGGGDASEGWGEDHFFAHDDKHAYDSAGKHPLPYKGFRESRDYVELGHDLEEWDADDEGESHEDALAHARRNGIMEGRYGPRAHRNAKLASSNRYYHVAPRDAREGIAEHGIDWRRSPLAEHPLRAYNDEGETIELPRANYLYRTEESAREAIPATGESDLYEVDATGHELHRDPYEDTEAVYTHEPVHPSKIRRIGKLAGANGDLPEGITFRHGGPYELPDDGLFNRATDGEHEIRADHEGRCIGHLKWLTKVNPSAGISEGHITYTGVRGEYHRRGVATEMLRRAREVDPRVHHSHTLTPEGRAWSEKQAARITQMHQWFEHHLGEINPEDHVGDHGELPTHAYRVMDDEHYRQSLRQGWHQSDERNNYIGQHKNDPELWGDEMPEAEGTVASVGQIYPHYSMHAPSGRARVVKIKLHPEDGWVPHPDYDEGDAVRTFKPIPTSRFVAATPPFRYNAGEFHTARFTPDKRSRLTPYADRASVLGSGGHQDRGRVLGMEGAATEGSVWPDMVGGTTAGRTQGGVSATSWTYPSGQADGAASVRQSSVLQPEASVRRQQLGQRAGHDGQGARSHGAASRRQDALSERTRVHAGQSGAMEQRSVVQDLRVGSLSGQVSAAARGSQGATTSSARFSPSLRIFSHTCGLDHRLWDADEKLKPEVRRYVLRSISQMWAGKYANWKDWARIYFAGSEASEWTSDSLEGNNDFDVLIGVDYSAFRKANPSYRHVNNARITDEMNAGFRAYNSDDVMLDVDGTTTGPWSRTTYVNPDSYNITKIKPYAAYDVGKNEWVVKPPHLPHWDISDFPKPVVRALRAADAYAHSVLKLPEPERTQQGAALFDAWHADRSRAFSERGEGWFDLANLREKWLDQEGVWAELVNCKHRANQGLDRAPADWSNTPPGYVAVKTAARRTLPHSEIAKLRFVDFPGEQVEAVRARLKRNVPEYYQALHDHIAEHGVQNPVLLRRKPRGRFDYVMDGTHRTVIAHELGQDIPVGDYDDEKDYDAAYAGPGAREWANKRWDLDARRGSRKTANSEYEFGREHGLIGTSGNMPFIKRRLDAGKELDDYDQDYVRGHQDGSAERVRRVQERAKTGDYECRECAGSGMGPWRNGTLCTHCGGTGSISSEEAHKVDVLHHLTDDPHFKPDPNFVPEDNAIAVHQRSRPGLFAAHPDRLDTWVHEHGYDRPYVAEIHVPRFAHEPGRWGGERFIPAEHFDKAVVHCVMPREGHEAKLASADVHPDWQRRGIASELFRRAKEITPSLHHAPTLTDEGRAWSQKTAVMSDDEIREYDEQKRQRRAKYWSAAELVPMHEFAPMRPLNARDDKWESPEYLDNLKREVVQHGFQQPVAIMRSEMPNGSIRHELWDGNHRHQVGKELAATHLPAVVVRSEEDYQAGNFERPSDHGFTGEPTTEQSYHPWRSKTASTMYHWAPSDAREDIATHGIDYQRAPGHDPASHGPHGNFLHHDEATARDWVPGIHKTHDLYAVDTNGLRLRSDPYDTGDASYVTEPIEPHRIYRTAKKLPRSQKCAYCKEQATQRVIHSEGMAYVPCCDKHLSKAKDAAARCTPDGSYDESNIDAVRKIAVQVSEYEGDVGNRDHITRSEIGNIPTDVVRNLHGARGEVPGEHSNRRGQDWEDFKADIARNGIREPIFITVDHGEEPKLNEGSHRRDAAVELGMKEIPAEVRYFGHAEQQGTLHDRAGLQREAIYEHRPAGPPRPDDFYEGGQPAHDLNFQRSGDQYGDGTVPGSRFRVRTLDDKTDTGTARILRRARGNPEHPITMYRALHRDHVESGFRPGDWVTLSRSYAQDHARANGGYAVIKATVPAKHLWTDGDYNEWGYHGEPVQGEIHTPGRQAGLAAVG